MNTQFPLTDNSVLASHRKWVTVTKVPLVAVERRAATMGDTRLAPIGDIRRQMAPKRPSLNGLNGQIDDAGGDD